MWAPHDNMKRQSVMMKERPTGAYHNLQGLRVSHPLKSKLIEFCTEHYEMPYTVPEP